MNSLVNSMIKKEARREVKSRQNKSCCFVLLQKKRSSNARLPAALVYRRVLHLGRCFFVLCKRYPNFRVKLYQMIC